MKRLAAIPVTAALSLGTLALVALPLMPQAQSAEESRDRDFLTALIEDNLSAPGQTIRLEGFAGALSSVARFDSLSIADETGVWLRIEGAELDWSRSALLRGRFEVNSLTAAKISLSRLPVRAAALPAAEATEFTPPVLPDLPVSVNIGEISTDLLSLAQPVLGQAIAVSMNGAMSLLDGDGEVRFELSRVDGIAGDIRLVSGYNSASQELSVDLSLFEEPGGLLATSLGLPGAPSLEFTARGAAPLSDFGLDITLASDGAPRLAGVLALKSIATETAPDQPPPAPDWQFRADISGDMTPLFNPGLRDFWGPEVSLQATGLRRADGRLTLDPFVLSARALRLTGALDMAADGAPQSFDLRAELAAQDGAAVRLPLPGPPTSLQMASLTARYDAAKADQWTLTGMLEGLSQGALTLDSGQIRAGGLIGRRANTVRAVTADLALNLTGLAHSDPALQQVLGDAMGLQAELQWREGESVALSVLDLSSGDLSLAGDVTIGDLSSGFAIEGQARLNAGDLQRFAALTSTNIGGALRAGVTGRLVPLGGAFDLRLTGQGQQLQSGIAPLDGLLAGAAELDIAILRDTGGIEISTLVLKTPALELDATGSLQSAVGNLEFAARLDNLGRIIDGLSGPAAFSGTASGSSDAIDLDLAATGPGGIRALVQGKVLDAGQTLDLALNGTLPLALVNSFTTELSLLGDAGFDLVLRGAPALSSLSGRLTSEGASLSLPAYNTGLNRVRLSADIAGNSARITASGVVIRGGEVALAGTLGLGAPYPGDLEISLNNVAFSDPDLYRTSLNGQLSLRGPISGGARLAGTVDLGRTELQLPSGTSGSGGSRPDIRHIAEPREVRATRLRAGVLVVDAGTAPAPPLDLDILLRAPNQLFVRGRGLDAELGGALRLSGTSRDIVPLGEFSLIRGRLDILGKRITLQEGSAVLQGSFDPWLRLVAETTAQDTTVRVISEGTASELEISFSSDPDLPEDEILARLLFGRAIDDISALQAARLVSSLNVLAGGRGGLVSRLRQSFGLDDLDLSTDTEGNTALRVGKYLSDNIYTDITVDQTGKSEINLNLDLSDSVSVKGRLGDSGDTGIGIFFERDY
ncbi:translocation/assembly module TamB domain-containing protein [Candidatus Halocynthiibacter alkanivorans]|uniref:translocation/assembly module TamB domain-containing protein n=1 Tax=Candidatus Halocynthiibacter alkanivorans TaxID=2267619 RepID=UPI000DF26435|nr:translocation/assembly module TamB domain-containing protein [Candidatus Halocynthiibacter alkanivorans]